MGTSGKSLRTLTPSSRLDAHNYEADGVQKLTLRADSYDWDFIPVAGKTYSDRGTGMVHGAPLADSTAPDTVITSGPSGSVLSTSATFEFTSPEAGSTFQCSLDGGSYRACASPTTDTNLSGGSHVFRVRAVDGAGNVDASPASRSWTVDATTLTFDATADAFVSSSSANANSNFGTSTVLHADTSDTTYGSTESYLKFDVSRIAGTVQSVKLRLYITNGTADGPVLYSTQSDWTETGLTWNTRPARGVAGGNKGSIGVNVWVEYDLTNLVKADGTYSFVLVPGTTDGLDAHSRENTLKPQLVVTLAP